MGIIHCVWSQIWPFYVDWDDGSRDQLFRRQIPKIITDPATGRRYLLNGVDLGNSSGNHYGTCWTLLQPLNDFTITN